MLPFYLNVLVINFKVKFDYVILLHKDESLKPITSLFPLNTCNKSNIHSVTSIYVSILSVCIIHYKVDYIDKSPPHTSQQISTKCNLYTSCLS